MTKGADIGIDLGTANVFVYVNGMPRIAFTM